MIGRRERCKRRRYQRGRLGARQCRPPCPGATRPHRGNERRPQRQRRSWSDRAGENELIGAPASRRSFHRAPRRDPLAPAPPAVAGGPLLATGSGTRARHRLRRRRTASAS